ncbi:hypothetical protein EYZ11_008928 [Aspergillus tanneri]|nr:hypothetical protein EYZ11_008928 [Aspergillus tanneri]
MNTLRPSRHSLLGFITALLAASAAAASNCSDAAASTISVSIPMRSSPLGPLFNLSVGTPPQPMTVLSDWTWMSLFTRSAHCGGSYSATECIPSGQQWFNERRSTTFQNTSFAATGWENTSFLPGVKFAVTYGKDTVCIGDICSDGTVIQLSNFSTVVTEVVPFGGIFGLAPVLPPLNETFYPASYQAYLGGKFGPQVGIHSCAALSSKETCNGDDMLTVFGCVTGGDIFDPSDLVFFDIEVEECLSRSAPLNVKPGRDNFWAVRWTGMWIGTEMVSLQGGECAIGCDDNVPRAVFDEGSEGYGAPVPHSALASLLQVTNATMVNTSAGTKYSIPCGMNLDDLPTLTYELQDKQNYTILPSTYVTYRDDGCYDLDIKAWDFNKNGPMALFGQTFLERLYVVLDFATLQVGLAPLREELLV